MEDVMRATILKWGDGAAVRLPASVLTDAGLAVDSAVDVRVEDGCVVVERLAPAGLDALLAAITPENLHNEADLGAAEAWRAIPEAGNIT